MSIGLGYVARGIMQGRQQNIQDSLRRNEEERRQKSFGLQQRIDGANAIVAENNASDENINLHNQTQQANADIATANASRSGRMASQEWMDTEYAGINAGVTGKQLNNQFTQQGIDLRSEQLTPEAKDLRQQEQKFKASDLERREVAGKIDLRVKQRNEELLKLTHLNDKTLAQQQREELTDMDAYETVKRLKQGDKRSAIRLFNELDSNGIYDAIDLTIQSDGSLLIERKNGEKLIYPAEEIAARDKRVEARITKDRKAPETVMHEEYIRDEGGKIMRDAYGEPMTRKVPLQFNKQTGKFEKIEIEATKQALNPNDVDSKILENTWKKAVLSGEMSPERFESKWGYDPTQQKGVFLEGGIPLTQDTTSTVTAPPASRPSPRMDRGVSPAPLGASGVTQPVNQNGRPDQNTVVGGLNGYVQDLFDQPTSIEPRPLSRR